MLPLFFGLPALLLFSLAARAQPVPVLPRLAFEQNPNVTATYAETVDFYRALAGAFPDRFRLERHGATDSGEPLHLGILSIDGDFDPASVHAKDKVVLFINNAIHPGEPCGVDATMLLLRDYLLQPAQHPYLDHLVLVVIPFYNIGGGLNRNSFSRANQLGPEAYGFRGNARNLDLNRDFIKCDSRNARTFNRIYNAWMPEVFIDNHTSNGADYQYTQTIIPTQHNKLNPALAGYLQSDMLPRLFRDMADRSWEMTPYVNARNTPDEGIAGFLDLPRYSSGYAALHHALSFMPEAHMLKPYADRVRSTYTFMDVMVRLLHEDYRKVIGLRKEAVTQTQKQTTFDLNWTPDPGRADTFLFKGYEAAFRPSAVSGLDRLYYDRSRPFAKPIPHYNYYRPTFRVNKPLAYIIPQAYAEVIERLQWNGVQMRRLHADTAPEVDMYRIRDYKSTDAPYEGHYLHYQVEVDTLTGIWPFRAGDYVVFLGQPADRYIVETLEPQGPDSFFAWNFFDGILMQKEYFSSYVFEDLAAAYLEQHPELRGELEARKKTDEAFARSARAQLNFVYERSPYYEPTYRRYPVARLVNPTDLPLE